MTFIRIIDEIKVPCLDNIALNFLQNLDNLQKYEPKVSKAQVFQQDKKQGFYVVSGYFVGIPWGGEFSYQLTKNGFHSEMRKGPLAGKVKGGFVVTRESNNSCKIEHYEEYIIPNWLFWLTPLIHVYLHLAMKKELRSIYGSLTHGCNI